MLRNKNSTTTAAIEALKCESTLYVMFALEDGKLVHALDGTVPVGFKVKPRTVYVKDAEFSNESPNKVAEFGFQLVDGWSREGFTVSSPTDFSADEDLANS